MHAIADRDQHPSVVLAGSRLRTSRACHPRGFVDDLTGQPWATPPTFAGIYRAAAVTYRRIVEFLLLGDRGTLVRPRATPIQASYNSLVHRNLLAVARGERGW